MNIRETYEELEYILISDMGIKSKESKGRQYPEEKCPIRTEFQRDRDRILHSKSFRRLKHKTQVFISPEGDHYRTRLTHTLEVAQISRTIARALSLNEDLTEAIALGHDLGHTPFGHIGEEVLNKLNPFGFKHNEQSLRVVEVLESKSGLYGLNLSKEVKDGIKNHSGDFTPNTNEGKIVRISDRIAYLNHDIDDALRANLISIDDFDKEILNFFEIEDGNRLNKMVYDLISNSSKEKIIANTDEVKYYMDKLREFLFQEVYLSKETLEDRKKIEFLIENIYLYYKKNLEKLPQYYIDIYNKFDLPKDIIVTDYIAGMTDRYMVNLYNELFMPKKWNVF